MNWILFSLLVLVYMLGTLNTMIYMKKIDYMLERKYSFWTYFVVGWFWVIFMWYALVIWKKLSLIDREKAREIKSEKLYEGLTGKIRRAE